MILIMRSRPRSLVTLLAVVIAAAGCRAAAASPSAATAQPSVAPASATPTPGLTANPSGIRVRFVDPADGSSVAATRDPSGRPLVPVRIQVDGAVAMLVYLTANGLPAVDKGGHQLEAENKSGANPYTAEIAWSPAEGGGDYTLVATAMDTEKNVASATIKVTVTGIPHVTLPPALTESQARAKVTQLIRDQFKVMIPRPSLQRFDFPTNPTRSRWIGAAYYMGMRYYVSIFDDGHVEWQNGPYADPAHRSANVYMCRPAGSFKVLVVFVDYGNTGIAKSDAMAAVQPVVTWLNGLYAGFASSQGFGPFMTVSADGAWVSAPPVHDALLTPAQIKTSTGKDVAAYDFTMQIDLDVDGGWGVHSAPGVMEPGGGFALNGCGRDTKFPAINIWSSIGSPGDLQGGLVMDFDHELSHLFGMMDDYPYKQDIAGPGSNRVDDWIPYVLFGWTDTDGDGVAEIVDPTPYGTTGPKP